MQNVLFVIQIIVSILLVIAVLLQVKGNGFGRVWGGMGGGSFSKRGLEGLVFKSTFVLVFLFLSLSILILIS